MPVRGVAGTGYPEIRPDFKIIDNPYGEDEVVLVPPLRPRASLIHSMAADPKGNILTDAFDNDALLARASRQVYASTERIVGEEELKTLPGVVIPAAYIKGVILLKGGGKPTRCRGFYPYGEKDLLAYLEAARDRAAFEGYVGNLLQEGGDEGWLE